MLRYMTRLTLLAVVVSCIGAFVLRDARATANKETTTTMDLGNFSISLAVKDLETSRAFYEKLGFAAIGGDASQNWLILRNGETKIGLFQGMFDKNIMTFNPGWSSEGENLDEFTDVREIQRRLQEAGITPVVAADPASTGPAHSIVTDPDGNTIMFDQHR